MSIRTLYLDSSAIVKLVLPALESDALRSELIHWPRRVTSMIAEVEVIRAVRRASTDPELLARAHAVFDQFEVTTLNPEVIHRAALVEPVDLRSLDAIHLASALQMGVDLGGVVTYDERLSAGVRGAGVQALQPR